MRERYLLGANKYDELVFGNFEITKRNGYPEFSASFDTVRPFRESSIDLVEYFEGFVEDCGKEYAYELCERNHCAPQELPKELADSCYDVRDAIDCSLYPEWYTVDDEDWYFESSAGGQHDTRGEMTEYTDKRAYDLLHDLWDKYHLKDIRKYNEEQNVRESVDTIKCELSKVDEEKWICDYIRRNF